MGATHSLLLLSQSNHKWSLRSTSSGADEALAYDALEKAQLKDKWAEVLEDNVILHSISCLSYYWSLGL